MPLSIFTALVLVVTACTPSTGGETTTTLDVGSTSSSTSTTTTSPPDGFGGAISVGIGFIPISLNPFSADATPESELVGNAIWATVYDIDPVTRRRVADNVTALPSETPGGIVDNGDGTITVQYQVARRATWSDGAPMTGADLAFTAEAMRELALFGNPLVDPIMATVVETDSVEQVAWITYSEASLVVEDALWIILPAHSVNPASLTVADGLDWPSGGPFMVEGADPSVLVRNPNYWKTDESGRQLPYADMIEFVGAGEDAPSFFADRGVSVVGLNPSAENRARIEGLSADGAIALTAASPIVEQLTFNFRDGRAAVNDVSYNDALAYREAIAHALDRESLIVESGVPWIPATGILVPGGTAWSRYAFSPATSRSLVTSLDPTSEPEAILSTTVNADERPSVAVALEGSFAPIGVGYETDLQDSLVFFQGALPDGTYDLGMWAWLNDGGIASTLTLLELFLPSNDPGAFSGWGVGSTASDASVRYSELAAIAASSTDAAVFWEAVAEAEEILAAELPLIPLFNRTTLAAVWSDTITGVQANGSDNALTWNVESWQVVGE